MWCNSKKEMLEHLGKNGKDVRYINRAIMRGEVIEKGCRYILAKEYIEELEKGKEKSDTKFISKAMGEKVLAEGEIMRLQDELYEARAQWEYYQSLYEEEVKDKQDKIRKCFQWIKRIKPSADWEEFRDWVMDDSGL